MYDGYMSLGTVELINKERTAAYIKAFLPGIDVLCEDAIGLRNALGKAAYVSPAADGAPWYRSIQPDTADFYGIFPSVVSGDQDSTREIDVTELIGDGAVQSIPRHSSKEIKVRAVLIGKTEAGVAAGLAWLRSVLDDSPCGANGVPCEGRELSFFTANPSASTSGAALALVGKFLRIMYRVDTLSGPRVVEELPSRRGYMTVVEFILNAGVPWAFSVNEATATTTGITPTTRSETYCPTVTDAYDDVIVDPNDPVLLRPPRPPVIEPVTMPTSWSQYTMSIPTTQGYKIGRVVPTVVVTTGASAVRKLRVRFYKTGFSSYCDFEGEFFITYVPANAILEIHGPKRQVEVTVSGKTHPGSNLVIGSNGRPATWPSMACNSAYTVVVDSVGAIGSTVVRTDVAIRE